MSFYAGGSFNLVMKMATYTGGVQELFKLVLCDGVVMPYTGSRKLNLKDLSVVVVAYTHYMGAHHAKSFDRIIHDVVFLTRFHISCGSGVGARMD